MLRHIPRRIRCARRRAIMARDAWRHLPPPEPVSAGRFTYFDGLPRIVRYPGDVAAISIGSFCSIASGTTFLVGGNHRLDWVTTFPLWSVLPGAVHTAPPQSRGDIVIGNDVWVGRGVTVLSGVTIGDGAVIGAEAVVREDVRPYAVVVGNPAQEVRRRFTDEEVAQLLEIAWWDWPEDLLREHAGVLCSGRLADLAAIARGPLQT
jgi:chloramphenicol O-acetyltransferase type B